MPDWPPAAAHASDGEFERMSSAAGAPAGWTEKDPLSVLAVEVVQGRGLKMTNSRSGAWQAGAVYTDVPNGGVFSMVVPNPGLARNTEGIRGIALFQNANDDSDWYSFRPHPDGSFYSFYSASDFQTGSGAGTGIAPTLRAGGYMRIVCNGTAAKFVVYGHTGIVWGYHTATLAWAPAKVGVILGGSDGAEPVLWVPWARFTDDGDSVDQSIGRSVKLLATSG